MITKSNNCKFMDFCTKRYLHKSLRRASVGMYPSKIFSWVVDLPSAERREVTNISQTLYPVKEEASIGLSVGTKEEI